MARKQDEMSLDEELTAAFLEDEGAGLGAEAGMVDTIDDAPADTEILPEEEALVDDPGAGDWDDPASDLPGQLAVDVYETNEKLIVKARTAGIERKDLDVSIEDNILSISGVLNGGDSDNVTQWHIQECYWGEFNRTVALPVQVKEDGVEAVLKDGVLTISFQKERVKSPTVIQVN